MQAESELIMNKCGLKFQLPCLNICFPLLPAEAATRCFILGEGLKCKLHLLKTPNVISYIPLELVDRAGEVCVCEGGFYE